MSDPLFDVILEGELLAGYSHDQAADNVANLFKISAVKASALLSGGERVIKQSQPEGAARKYQAALKRAGVKVRLEEVRLAANPTAEVAETVTTAANPEEAVASVASNAGPEYSLTLAPQEGNLLKRSEVPPSPPAPALNLDNLSLAPGGSDVLESKYRKPTAATIEPPANLRIVDSD